MGGRGGGSPRRGQEASVAAKSPVNAEQAVRDAYARLVSPNGEWVNLTRLREALPESFSRNEVDEALRSIARGPGGNLVPESNQKAMTQKDWDSTLWFGNQHKHLLSIRPGE